MICDHCNTDTVRWVGDLVNPSGTRCSGCAGTNCQKAEHQSERFPSEGGTCPLCDEGELEYPPAKNCSCHISPPCAACVEVVLTCPECGEEFPEDKA